LKALKLNIIWLNKNDETAWKIVISMHIKFCQQRRAPGRSFAASHIKFAETAWKITGFLQEVILLK
jgi:hypothetical protein